MELPVKLFSAIAAGGSAMAALWGGGQFVDERYAKSADLVLVEMRLDQKILTDRRDDMRKQIREIQGRYGEDLFEAPGPVKDHYASLQHELRDIEQEITGLQEDYRRKGNSANRYYERKMSDDR